MTMRPGPRHGWAATSAAALLGLAACTALAGAPTSGTTTPAPSRPRASATTVAAKPAAAPAGTLGLIAFLDPETGQLTGPISYLVPPADQRVASANVLLEPVRTRSGGWLMDLKGTGMESYILQIDPLGNRRVVCVQDARRVPVLLPLTVMPAGEER